MRKLDYYLGKLIQAQLSGREVEPVPEGVTVSEITTIAKKNQMMYLLLEALMRAENISEEDKKNVRGMLMLRVCRAETQIYEFQELEKCFEKSGIRNQPMKGAVLRYLYPSPEMREMSDLDILIAPQDMEAADAILRERGYVMTQSVKHHDIYKKPPFLVVEVHRAMYDKTVDRNQNGYFQNFTRTRTKEGCQYTQVLGINDFYVYMMAHMAKHFYQMGCGIRHLVDLYVYLKKYSDSMDRAYIEKELEKCGILTFTLNMEQLATGWLDGKEVSTLHEKLFLYMLDSGIYGKDENGIWNKFVYDKNRDKKMSRGQLKRWYFFPPLYYMSEYFPYLEKKSWMLPWAWLMRGVGAVLGHKGSFKKRMIDDIEEEQIQALRDIYEEMELRFKS